MKPKPNVMQTKCVKIVTTPSRGGARKGSGRKLTGRVTVNFRVAAETAAWLRCFRNPGEMIDECVATYRDTAK